MTHEGMIKNVVVSSIKILNTFIYLEFKVSQSLFP